MALQASAMIPTVTLSSGWTMPVLGFGTASANSNLGEEQLASVFLDAIEAGYRHFDTAAAYKTERPLGRAIAEAVRRGLIRGREEVFVTSKLWLVDAAAELVLPAINKSLQNLGLDYLDLYLIHWPIRLKPGEIAFSFNKEDLLPLDIKSTWAAMEECQRLDLAKSIGVSNFSCKKLSELLAHATIPPAVDQVEMSPLWDQRRLRGFCKENGIHVTAWSPLGANGAFWGSPVMENLVLKEIAEMKGKTLPQVSLRFIYEQGASAVVKSFNRERMRENIRIFDWELSNEEKEKIKEIPQKRGFLGEPFVSPNGPYKTFDDLWDGEM